MYPKYSTVFSQRWGKEIYLVLFFSDIKCLKSVMESGTQSLSPKCKAKLEERLIMYKSAAQVSTLIYFFSFFLFTELLYSYISIKNYLSL